MKSLLIVGTLVFLSLLARSLRAREAKPVQPTPERVQPLDLRALPEGPTGEITVQAPALDAAAGHPTPRVKLSYVHQGVADGGGGSMPLQALHLDLYPLSWRWLRAGVEVEAGRGRGTILGAGSSVHYGLVGVNLGLQIPRRITPFIEGRIAGGVIATRPGGAVIIPGTPISVGGAGSSFLLTRGVDVGVELYTWGHNYLSAAIGYTRTSFQMTGFDAHNTMVSKQVTQDGWLLKIGLGF